MHAVHEWKPDLVITDISMPEMNGVELCREIRTVSQVPIIVLSVRNQDLVKVEALDAGADDYVTKPFSIQELQARVRAQLRRSKAASEDAPQIIKAGDFVIDIPQHRVIVRGQDTHLTPKQFDLLVHLAQHPGQVLTHRALLHAVWGTNADQPEYLRVNIGQLRKKIERSEEPAYILTEPWIGYRFRPTGNDDF
jgi:two-component system KDP operon response regulator KdpE